MLVYIGAMSESAKAYPPGPMRQYRGPQKDEPPPRARRPRHVELIALFSALAVLFLVIAWYIPIKTFLLRHSGPRLTAEPRESYTFAALAYGPVGPDGVSLDQLTAHVDALTSHGYVPIALDDVVHLLRTGRPLPPNAVLLTFDQPRADTWRDVASLIRTSGWRATLFLDPSGDGEQAYRVLSSRDIRVALGERRWEIGSLGWGMNRPVPVNEDGADGPFFTSLAWMGDVQRHETVYDFRDRLVDNLDRARREIQREALVSPRAFAYPGGYYGSRYAEPLARRYIRMALVSRAHDLAFLSGELAYNTRHSDPMRLNRLRVDATWNATDLIQRLQWLADASPLLRYADGQVEPGAWMMDGHGVAVSNQWMMLSRESQAYAYPRVWMAGGEGTGDGVYASEVRVAAGSVSWYIGASDDESLGVRITLTSDGRVAAHALRRELEAEPLAESQVSPAQDGLYVFRAMRRGTLLHVTLNEEDVFSHPIRFRSVQPGHAGIGAGILGDASRVQVRRCTWSPMPEHVATWDGEQASMARVAHYLHRHAYRFPYMSPALPHEQGLEAVNALWAELMPPVHSLAGMYASRVYPALTVSTALDPYRALPPTDWLPWMEQLDCDGILLRLIETDDARAQDWVAWIGEAHTVLQRAGKSLMIRMPRAFEQLHNVQAMLGVLPGVQLVRTDQDGSHEDETSDRAVVVREEQIDEQWPALAEWPLYDELKADQDQVAAHDTRREAERLEREGEQALRDGRFEDAIVFYSDWHELDATNPTPLNKMAEALLRLRFRDEAVDFLALSLELDPGQIERAMALAEWLDVLGREEEARMWLNRYALLFPGDARIQIAQVKWLLRRNRLPEARERALTLHAREPDHLEAAVLALQLAERSEDRRSAVGVLLDAAEQPEQHRALIEFVRAYDLLMLPETELLANVMMTMIDQVTDPRARRLLREMYPRKDVLRETYSDARLSDAWRLDGGEAQEAPGGVRLQTEPERQTLSAILLGSHGWRDTFVEARAQRGQGQLWLTARQTRRHLLRFGWDESRGQWLLQWWDDRNQALDVAVSMPAEAPDPDWSEATLRLEVRGRGAMGFVNGEAMFDAPLRIPADMGPGRVTLEAFDDQPGAAHFMLASVSAGPLPMRMALLQGDTPAAVEQEIQQFQPLRSRVTDLAPVWFARDDDGEWISDVHVDDGLARLLARYYGYRLMPVARMPSVEGLSGHALRDLINLHDVDGLTIWCEQAPTEEWFETFSTLTEVAGLTLIFLNKDADRAFGMGMAENPGRASNGAFPVQVIPWRGEAETTGQEWSDTSVLFTFDVPVEP